MKKRNYITITIILILFLAGLALLLYPFAANQWNTYRQSKLIADYGEHVEQLAESGKIDFRKEWERAQEYNDALIPYILPDSFAEAESSPTEDEDYMQSLNVMGNGMMGYVEIPKINIRIPIFHTTNKDVLEKGAGHLEGSSLPIGGENGHAVISAHRGLPSAALFTDLDQLVIGDYFLLHILDDVLCYQVDKITVVEPTDTSDLVEEDGQDLVTLLTCTPYGVNSHRLLVRGHRITYESIETQEMDTLFMGPSLHTNYLLWVAVGLAVTAAFIILLYLIDRHWKRSKAADRKKTDSDEGGPL